MVVSGILFSFDNLLAVNFRKIKLSLSLCFFKRKVTCLWSSDLYHVCVVLVALGTLVLTRNVA
jgi:hypothetical protein